MNFSSTEMSRSYRLVFPGAAAIGAGQASTGEVVTGAAVVGVGEGARVESTGGAGRSLRDKTLRRAGGGGIDQPNCARFYGNLNEEISIFPLI